MVNSNESSSSTNVIDLNSIRIMKDCYNLDYRSKGDKEYDLKSKFVKFSYSLTTQILDPNDDSKINDELFNDLAVNIIPSEIKDELEKQNLSIHNILNDLNVISSVEKMIGLTPLIFAPKTSETNLFGWLSIFNMFDLTFSSPELDNENKSRLFSLLVFFQLKNSFLHS
jgi:hypothetical protein